MRLSTRDEMVVSDLECELDELRSRQLGMIVGSTPYVGSAWRFMAAESAFIERLLDAYHRLT